MGFIKKFTSTKSLKINAIFNAIYQILTMIVPLITTPYVSRVLGVVNNGLYSYYYSIVTYFVLVATFGFNDFGTKYLAEVRDNNKNVNSRFRSISYSKLILGILVLLVYFTFNFVVFNNDNTAIMLMIIMVGFILSAILDPTFYFQANERFVSICLRNIFIRVLTTIAIFCFVKTTDDLMIYALILSIGQVLASLIMFFSFKGSGLHLSKVNRNDFFLAFKGSFSYFLPSLAVTLFGSLNQTLLGVFGYEGAESGYYGQATKVIQILATLVASINIIALSRISYLETKNDSERINEQIRKIFEVFWIMSMPIFFGLMAICNIFIPAFLGEEYTKSSLCTLIMSASVVLSPLNGLIGSVYYRPKNKIYLQTLFIIIACILNIITCVILIPLLQSIGSSIGKLVAEVTQLPLLVIFSRKYINYKQICKPIFKPLISSIIMFVCVFLFVNYLEFINTWLRIILGIGIGAFIYYLFEMILRDKFVVLNTKLILNFLKNIVKRQSKS